MIYATLHQLSAPELVGATALAGGVGGLLALSLAYAPQAPQWALKRIVARVTRHRRQRQQQMEHELANALMRGWVARLNAHERDASASERVDRWRAAARARGNRRAA